MMICRADFEELFPECFASDTPKRGETKPVGPSDTCMARWEDDGGRIAQGLVSSKAANLRRPFADSKVPNAKIAIMRGAMASNLFMYGAIWATLAGFGLPTRD